MKTYRLYFEANGEEFYETVQARGHADATSQGEMREYNDYYHNGDAHFVALQEMVDENV